jgi:hypothetical protein
MDPRTRLGAVGSVVMISWLSVVLWVDHAGSLRTQHVLGCLTWVVLGVALLRCSPTVRAQALVVVALATLVEYTFSPGLEVYLYRFHNVPAYVPPGHGLVYLSAFALGHTPFLQRHLRGAVVLVLGSLGVWAAYGALVAARADALGLVWFLCLAAFVRWGPSREVYLGAGVVVTWLELMGTRLGTWSWQPRDPVGWLPIGNPPSGAAGGYGWFDLAALLVAPALLAGWSRLTSAPAPALPDADAS